MYGLCLKKNIIIRLFARHFTLQENSCVALHCLTIKHDFVEMSFFNYIYTESAQNQHSSYWNVADSALNMESKILLYCIGLKRPMPEKNPRIFQVISIKWLYRRGPRANRSNDAVCDAQYFFAFRFKIRHNFVEKIPLAVYCIVQYAPPPSWGKKFTGALWAVHCIVYR